MFLASGIWTLSKRLSRIVWFREGAVRRCICGPYKSLRFVIGPQMHSRMIVFYGAYESEVTDLLASVIRPGMTVGVIGAHVGIHALFIAKRLQGQGQVPAFEPWPDNFRYLKENVAHNTLSRSCVVPLPFAVGARAGTARLSAGETDGTHHITQAGETPALEVPIVTLDGYWHNIAAPPDLLLIDVEGEELSVLQGAIGLIQTAKPKLLLEHHGPDRVALLTHWLEQRRYVVSPAGPRHLYAQPAAA
jgi:FkbM family methyltransferase